MSEANVIGFLRSLEAQPEMCELLREASKDEVIQAAGEAGHAFTAEEFNSFVWGLEERLAEQRGEPFDERFPLWQLLWGRYYLEFLVFDLVPSLTETGILTPAEGET